MRHINKYACFIIYTNLILNQNISNIYLYIDIEKIIIRIYVYIYIYIELIEKKLKFQNFKHSLKFSI